MSNNNNVTNRNRNTKEYSSKRNNKNKNSMNRSSSMNSINNKLEKSERKFLLHGRIKVNERRKYSMC